MRSLISVFAILTILVIAGCGELVIGQPQTKPEPVPHCPCQPEQQQVEREVLAFTSPWCGGCRTDKPKLTELRRQGVKITEINVEVQRTGSITAIIAIVKWLLIRIIAVI